MEKDRRIYEAASRLAERICDFLADDEDLKDDTAEICTKLGFEFGSDEFLEVFDKIQTSAIKQL